MFKIGVGREALKIIKGLLTYDSKPLYVASDNDGNLIGTTMETDLDSLVHNKEIDTLYALVRNYESRIFVTTKGLKIKVNPLGNGDSLEGTLIRDVVRKSRNNRHNLNTAIETNNSYIEVVGNRMYNLGVGMQDYNAKVGDYISTKLKVLVLTLPNYMGAVKLIVTKDKMVFNIGGATLTVHSRDINVDYITLQDRFSAWFGITKEQFEYVF